MELQPWPWAEMTETSVGSPPPRAPRPPCGALPRESLPWDCKVKVGVTGEIAQSRLTKHPLLHSRLCGSKGYARPRRGHRWQPQAPFLASRLPASVLGHTQILLFQNLPPPFLGALWPPCLRILGTRCLWVWPFPGDGVNTEAGAVWEWVTLLPFVTDPDPLRSQAPHRASSPGALWGLLSKLGSARLWPLLPF